MTPYFGGRDPRAVPAGFDRGEHGLAPVRSATWHDWIFVNLNGAAPPLEDFVAPLRTWLDGLDLTEIHHLATIDLGEIAANWKLLVENFIEPYHVQFVHSTTTEQPLTDHYTINQSGCLGMRRRRLRRGDAGGHAVGRFPLPDPVPQLRALALPAGPDRGAPRRAAGAESHPAAPRHLQPRPKAGIGGARGAARKALA